MKCVVAAICSWNWLECPAPSLLDAPCVALGLLLVLVMRANRFQPRRENLFSGFCPSKSHPSKAEKVPTCNHKETHNSFWGKPMKVYGRIPSYRYHMATKRRQIGDKKAPNGIRWCQKGANMQPKGVLKHLWGEADDGVRPYTFLSASLGDKKAPKSWQKCAERP